MDRLSLPCAAALLLFFGACNKINDTPQSQVPESFPLSVGVDTLPAPYATPSASHFSSIIPWPAGRTPTAPAGFSVTKFATSLLNPRWIYQGPNGDIFVAEAATATSGANRITLLRDANHDGVVDFRSVFLSSLHQPLGMLILNKKFYVANTDGVFTYPYSVGMTAITAAGTKILSLPAGGYNNHWTRNLLVNANGTKIYVSVGSGTNVGEQGPNVELRRADILEINPDGSGERIVASGLRNPVGMAWYPGTNTLWTSVNERDLLGDNLVPDYLTSVRDGGFYGWPYAYFGQHPDPRLQGQRPDLVAKSIVPDVDLGSHTASLGLSFYDKKVFPLRYQNGAFIGQHGSWNRSQFSGYGVVFVPFSNGKPSGRPESFLSGFIANPASSQVYGRPSGVLTLTDGSLLVADDAGNTIWRLAYKTPQGLVARAGDDITIGLAWNFSPLLNATLSSDSGGWFTSTVWTKVSGPNTYTIATPSQLQTRVSFTGTGTYIFRITLHDNHGATAYDDVQVTVNK